MLTKTLAGAALASLGLTLAATGAYAQPANTQTCLQMSHQVTDALSANAQSDSYKAARDEQSIGKTECLSGQYGDGVAHYSKALELLGVSNAMAQAGHQMQTP